MCGRYWITSPADIVTSRFRVSGERLPLLPRWNAAPGQDLPVVIAGEGRARERRLEAMRWGLVPSWANEPGDAGRPINARAETAAAKPSFRESFRRRRALVPADGFYEWLRRGPVSVPFGFRARSREPFAIAGLWDEWRPREGPPLRTFTLLTTEAGADVARIHDRMPAILAAGDEDLWLNPEEEDPGRLAPLLGPLGAGTLEVFPVSPRLNRPENDDPSVQDAPREDASRRASPPRREEERQRSLWENDGNDGGDGNDAA